LKGKRSIVRRIIGRTRSRFNLAIAEVDALDAHRNAVIGFAVVSNNARHANSMLDGITSFMVGATEAVCVGRTLEIMHTEGQPAPLPEWDASFGASEEDDDDGRQT
jgi:hypothetical protein